MATVPRVYSLGNAPIISIISHEIAQLSRQPKVPQVVLLLNDQKKLNRFLENDSSLTFENKNEKTRTFNQFMASCSPPMFASGEISNVENLIVAEHKSKAFTTSLQKYVKSVDPSTNLLLVNPGFGVIEYLYKNMWPEKDTRPNLFVAVAPQDCVTQTQEFNFALNSHKVPMRISPVPRDLHSYEYRCASEELDKYENTNDLLKLLKMTKESPKTLEMLFYSYGDLLLSRYEKLIIDSCIGPLTVLYDCHHNSELLKISYVPQTIDQLIKEQVNILTKTNRFLSSIPHATVALDRSRLCQLALHTLEVNKHGISKMKRDMDVLNSTDINQLNGYFVSLARYKKLDCYMNETIMNLVKGKVELNKYKALNYRYL